MPKLPPDIIEILERLPVERRPNKIRLAMALADVSQAEIVSGTGLSQPYVSDVVRGRFQTITLDNARKFAVFFGVPIETLFPASTGDGVSA